MIRLIILILLVISPNSKSPTTAHFVPIGTEQLIDTNDALIYNFAVLNSNQLIATSADRFKLYLIDINERGIVKHSGGKGQGPGEFGNYITNINVIGSNIVITTFDNWVHFFDLELKFIERIFIKDEIYQDLYKLNSNKYIGSGFSIAKIDEYKNNNYIFIKSNIDGPNDHIMSKKFTVQAGLPNAFLSKRIIGVGKKYVVSGQEGSNVVFFHDHDANLVNAIKLNNISTTEIVFIDQSNGDSEHPLRKFLELFGIDLRMPSGGYILSVFSGTNMSVIQGGVLTNYGPRSMTIINHKNWTQTETVLPDGCQLFDYYEETLYCLTEKADGHSFRKYNIVL